MNISKPRIQSSLLLLALSLTACDGGGGSGGSDFGEEFPTPPSTPFSLAAKNDVLREVGNYIVVHDAFFESEANSASALQAKALQNCTLAGQVDVVEASRDRDFEFYPTVTGVANYTSQNHVNCQEPDEDGVGSFVVTNGYVETGFNNTAANPFYGYTVYGRDGEAFRLDERETGAPASDTDSVDLLGTLESEFGSSQTETSYHVRLRLAERNSGFAQSGTIIHGDNESPMVATISADGLTLIGPYSYATTECVGGVGSISTLEPVTFAELISGSDTDFPISGQIQIGTGNVTAVVTFNGDGSATYSIEGGANQPLTLGEIAAATDAC